MNPEQEAQVNPDQEEEKEAQVMDSPAAHDAQVQYKTARSNSGAFKKSRYPAPDDRRCEAIAEPQGPYDWNEDTHRCGRYALWWCRRDGRQVCPQHLEKPNVKYARDGADRAGAYREMMALALGDAS